MKCKTGNRQTQQQAPIVYLDGAYYFVDFELSRFIEVDNPYNVIAFDTETGERMCGETLIMECPHCGTDQLICEGDSNDQKVCSKCRNQVSVHG